MTGKEHVSPNEDDKLFVEPRTPISQRPEAQHELYDKEGVMHEDDLINGKIRMLTPGFHDVLSDFKLDKDIRRNYFDIKNTAEEIESINDAIADSDDSMTEASYGAHVSHRTGGRIQLRTLLVRLGDALEKGGKSAKEFIDLSIFNKCGPVEITVKGVSVRKIAEQTKQNRLPLDSLLTFFVASRQTEEGRLPDGFFAENDSELARKFPKGLRRDLAKAGDIMTSLINVAHTMDYKEYRDAQKDFPMSAPVTKKLLEKTHEFHQRLNETIIDPDAGEFEATKQSIESYFQASPRTKNSIIYLFTYGDNEKFQTLYRKSLALAGHAEHGEFYRQFTGTLRNYADVVSDFSQLRTKDELEEVFTASEGPLMDAVPEPTDFRKQVASIIPNKPRDINEFVIKTEDIEWGEITKPQSAKIRFLPRKPMHFSVGMNYETEADETNILLIVDARKEKFDWNFIEDPDASDMLPFSNASKRIIKKILEQVDKKAKEVKLESQAAKDAQLSVSSAIEQPAIPKERPILEEEPVKRKRKRVVVSPLAVAEESAKLEEEGVRNVIIVPEDDDMKKVMKTLSAEDQALVLKGIENYNERGVGGFKMLVRRADDGNRLFALRINIGSKGVRVLLKEGEAEGKQRIFGIQDIKRRGSIYK